MTTVADKLLPDGLGQRIQPLLPPPPLPSTRWRAPHRVEQAWTPSACARCAGGQVGANPVDRAKQGCKLHLAVDGGGLPLSLQVTGANTNDSLVFAALLDDLPPVRTPAGRWRCRPEKVHADKAYDHRRCRG